MIITNAKACMLYICILYTLNIYINKCMYKFTFNFFYSKNVEIEIKNRFKTGKYFFFIPATSKKLNIDIWAFKKVFKIFLN